MIEVGEIPKDSPFSNNDYQWRSADITFEYTAEELEEIQKCAADVTYFANAYAYSMTDEGIQKITLRDYQVEALKDLQENRFNIWMASRQTGKSVISGIFLTWYFCFHFDRNVMVMANKGATMIEIIDKIKEVYKHLPFFLKPGVSLNNQSSMKFDNGNRLFGQATTKSAAIGFTIHLLFCDEFAHIPASYLEPFYRSVYPTLSSSKISRMIITSTPNGMNKFYEIYTAALIPKGEKGSNSFNALTTYWYQVAGRDEAWKLVEIGNLGSEEMFNQEYGLQFIASSKTLLGSDLLQFFKKYVVEFVGRDIDELNSQTEQFIWHPEWSGELDSPYYVVTIDIANGGGGDYSVLNLFVLEPIPIEFFDDITIIRDETSFFRLNQIGIFRSKFTSPEELAALTLDLLDWIDWNRIKVVLEINFKGEVILNNLEANKKYEDDMVLNTKHTDKSKYLLPGIRWNKLNKPAACQSLKFLMKQRQIHVSEKLTFGEMNSFGQDQRGNYKALGGNDDTMMTLVNLSQFINSEMWMDIVEEMYDDQDPIWIKAVEEKMNKSEKVEDEEDFSYLREFMN